MAYKLAIGAVLAAAIIFTLNDDTGPKDFNFTLKFDRLPEADWHARIRNEQGLVDSNSVKKTLKEIARGWDGQTVIVDDATGQPAEFCPDAVAALFDIPGFTDVALQAYLKEVVARVKN